MNTQSTYTDAPPNGTRRSLSGDSKDTAFSSSAARLLPTDNVYRRSLDYKESFDHSPDLVSEDDPLFFPNNKDGRRSKLRIALQALVALLALSLAYWTGRFSVNRPASTVTLQATNSASLTGPRNTFVYSNGTKFDRPKKLKIVGIIFFGRRQFVDILDCYLRRNLAVNGGMLDEVHFLLHTDEDKDKKWLQALVRQSKMEKYYKLKAEDTSGGWTLWRTFGDLYRDYMTDPDTIYIKIDDDIIFIDDYAIPELVRTTLEHPEAYDVVSNNVNNKWGYWLHHHADSISPYLADSDRAAKWPVDTWRPSELPHFSGNLPKRTHDFTRDYPPPFEGHRWLPLVQNESRAESITHTPWGRWLPNPEFHTGKTAVGWAVTAQAHYSLLENLESGDLSKYYFGRAKDYTWNLWYTRWNINFIAIRGSHVRMRPIWGEHVDKGDETLLTEVIPRELNMPTLVATRSIVAHFSFRGDRASMLKTDVLDRYMAYANELVCTADNQKIRFGPKLGPHHLPKQSHRPDAGEDHESDNDEIVDGPSDAINEGHDEHEGEDGDEEEH